MAKCPNCEKDYETQPFESCNWFEEGIPPKKTFFCEKCEKTWFVFFFPSGEIRMLSPKDKPDKMSFRDFFRQY